MPFNLKYIFNLHLKDAVVSFSVGSKFPHIYRSIEIFAVALAAIAKCKARMQHRMKCGFDLNPDKAYGDDQNGMRL